MIDFLEWLGNAYSFYQIFRDSGGWTMMMADPKDREAYMESFFMTKNML